MWYAERDLGGSQPFIQGYFEDEREAAEAADQILVRHKGDLSLLNFQGSQKDVVNNEDENAKAKSDARTEELEKRRQKYIESKPTKQRRECPGTVKKKANKHSPWLRPMAQKTPRRREKRKYDDSDSDYEDEPPMRSPPKRKKTNLKTNQPEPYPVGPRHGFYGICKMPRSGYEKWQARRRHPLTKKYITNGVYNTKVEAAKASDKIWLSFKSFEGWDESKLNFIEGSQDEDSYDDGDGKYSPTGEAAGRFSHARSKTAPAGCKSEKKTSKYIGVQRNKGGGFRAERYFDGKHIYGGMYENEEDAARASDRLVVKHNRQHRCAVNFPELLNDIIAEYSEDEDSEEYYGYSSPEPPPKKPKPMKKGSSYIGVQFRNGRFKVVRIIHGQVINGGDFENEIEAAHASDDLVRKHKAWGCRLNFPRFQEEAHMKEMRGKQMKNKKKAAKTGISSEGGTIKPRKKSKYVGVEPAGDGKWRAQRCINGERVVSKETFECDIKAAHASDDLVRMYATNTYATLNFPTDEERRAKAVERKVKLTSKYKGVHYTKKGLWRASRSIGGRKIMGGEFENELDAARASDVLAREHGSTGTLNFPTEDDDEYTPLPYKSSTHKPKPAVKKRSKFIGVTWNWRTRKWSAERAILGNKVHGGQWSDEEDAARASDRIARESPYFRGRFNFPTSDDENRRVETRKKRKKIEGPCPYFGVSIRGDRYYVSRTIRGKHYSGGSHDDEMEAVKASDNIVRREGAHGICKINIPTSRDLELIEEKRRSKYLQQKNITSKFAGVSWKAIENGWVAHRMINGIQTYGGTYDTELEAAKASDALVRRNNVQTSQKLNFPTAEETTRQPTFESRPVSNFYGVSRCGNKWKAERQIGEKRVFAGLYDKEVDAARASDALVRKQGSRASHLSLNFPEHAKRKYTKKTTATTTTPQKRSSKYVGVQWNVNAAKWQAERTIDGVKILGGLFESEMAAVRSADDIVRRERAYHCEINFPTNQEIELRRKALMSRLKTGYFGVRAGGYGTFHGARRNPETGETERSDVFETKESAARASDEIWRKINFQNPGKGWKLRLNFPDAKKTVIDLTADRASTKRAKGPRIKMVSGFYGIRKSPNGWEAVRVIDGKFKYNGLHSTKELAAKASDDLWKQNNGDPKELNFPAQQIRQAKPEPIQPKLEKIDPIPAPSTTVIKTKPIDLTKAKSLQDIFNFKG